MIAEPVGQALFPVLGRCTHCRREEKLHKRAEGWLCAGCHKYYQSLDHWMQQELVKARRFFRGEQS